MDRLAAGRNVQGVAGYVRVGFTRHPGFDDIERTEPRDFTVRRDLAQRDRIARLAIDGAKPDERVVERARGPLAVTGVSIERDEHGNAPAAVRCSLVRNVRLRRAANGQQPDKNRPQHSGDDT